jgi:hypothetical protein
MKRSLPIAAALASAVALTTPALADATTFCVAKPECAAAGGTPEPSLQVALNVALLLSPGHDRVEIGPGDFTLNHGFDYPAKAGESVDIVGSGMGVTRLFNSSTTSADHTLKIVGPPDSSVTDLSIVAPNPSGTVPIAWGLILSGTARRVEISGAQHFIAAQLSDGTRLEDSEVHGDPDHAALVVSGPVTVTGTSVETDGQAFAVSNDSLHVSRSRIDANTGLKVSGNASAIVTDSLFTTHGGPALATSFGVKTTLVATGNTLVGDGTPASVGIVAGEGSTGHNTNVTVANSVITGYGHSIVANQSGGGVVGKVSHSNFDDTTVQSQPGQIDVTGANTNVAPGFVDAGALNFRLAPGSALIDAGDPAVATPAELDLDGSARSLDGNGDGAAAPDIGAYEATLPAPPTPADPPPSDAPGGGTTAPPPVPPAQDKAPVISKLTIGKQRLVAGRKTRFRITLSEDARVKITLKRVGKSRRVRAAGSLSRRVHAGRNRIAFRGRVKRRALKPGRYVAVARATDSAGQHSAKRKVSFRIVKPGQR